MLTKGGRFLRVGQKGTLAREVWGRERRTAYWGESEDGFAGRVWPGGEGSSDEGAQGALSHGGLFPKRLRKYDQ